MRRAVIDTNGLVINVIEIEKDANWQPPEGCTLLTVTQSVDAGIGDTWDGKKIIKVIPITPEPIRDLAKEIDALTVRIAVLEKKGIKK